MGQGELFALDSVTFQRLLASASPALMDLIDEIEGGWDESHRFPCWKSWPELHKCLTGSLSNPAAGPEPLRECFLGSRYLTDPNGGYIVATLPADRVPGVARALEALGATWLRGQCARLFPYDDPDDWVEEVAGLLAGVREFYRRAAASGRSVLFTSDELLDRIYPPGGQA